MEMLRAPVCGPLHANPETKLPRVQVGLVI